MGAAVIVGIDLGTTNSAVAVWRNGAPELLPNSLGHFLTPSAVSIDKRGELLVGLAARERQVTRPEDTATAFKRFMGSRKTVTLGRRVFRPEELSALVLRSLKADAEAALGAPVTEAVITVPAYFNDKQRKATRRAGELAGLKVDRLINEPTAAALAYGIHKLADSSRFLVFDLGGGTFDVSVLEIFEGIVEVRASTGDNLLGGEDFNELLIDRMAKEHQRAWGGGKDSDPLLYQRLRAAAERARRSLSTGDPATMTVVWRDHPYELMIKEVEFEQLAETLLARLRDPVLRALQDGAIRAEELTEIVLVGGATRMPIVRRAVTRMFGRFPSATVNPDEAVALGAAVQAGLRARDAALEEVVLTDVCPYSLGVETATRLGDGSVKGGLFTPIIERNTIVPASRAQVFSTMQDGQREIEVNIFQGEARLVRDNVALGSLRIAVPARAAGQVALECRFTYDVDGLIEVDLHVPDTGERRQLVLVDDDEVPDRAALERRRKELAALKVHPRDRDENRAALARAERCFEMQLGDKREYVARLIAAFETVMEKQDPRGVEQGRAQLLSALDGIEGETFL